MDPFQHVLGNLSIFSPCTFIRVWRGDKENKNMASENHFNQTVLRRDRGWHRRALYLIRALPVVIGRNTQSGFYWITPALYRRGFTVIEQRNGRRGDSQMVLIKLRDDSYYMPYCSLTLLEAYALTVIPKSSRISFFFMAEIHMRAIILWSDSRAHTFPTLAKKHMNTVIQYRQ